MITDTSVSVAIIVPSFLSLGFTIFILYCYFKFDDLKIPYFELLAWICFYDSIWAFINFTIGISYLIVKNGSFTLADHKVICDIQSMLSIITILGNIIMTSSLCH